MNIQFFSHSSIIIRTGETTLWTDPWTIGKVFNNSWAQFPEVKFDQTLLDEINAIWISHEHPDHFNIPTLKSFPTWFKEKATVYFQKTNSDKMEKAFRQLGFTNIQLLPHREIVDLDSKTKVYCYQVGIMDSCLATIQGNDTILNINDAKIQKPDCLNIMNDIGKSKILLNQFSIAGFNGFPNFKENLKREKENTLEEMTERHDWLGAEYTIPFASFIYFCCEDNRFINEYANNPNDVDTFFKKKGKKLLTLYPGDCVETSKTEAHDSSDSLAKFESDFKRFDSLPFDQSPLIEVETIEKTFHEFSKRLHTYYPLFILKLLKPVKVYIRDLGSGIEFSIPDQRFKEVVITEQQTDLSLNSQPLFFALKFPFGIQTLGVSGRGLVLNNFKNWKYHRIIASLYNAEIYFRFRYLFRKEFLKFIFSKWTTLIQQLNAKLKRM